MTTLPKIKVILVLLFVCLMTDKSVSQETYHDKNGKVVDDPKTASFSRKIFKKEGHEYPYFEELYYPSRQKKRTGFIKDLDFSSESFVEKVTTYYENGNIEYETIYHQDNENVTTLNYYPNGQLHTERIRLASGSFQKPFYQIITVHDSLGNILIKDGKGFIRENNDGDFEEGHYENGLRTGAWKGTFFKGRYSFEEDYKNGEVTTGKSNSKENGTSYTYTQTFSPPTFKDGMNKFRSSLASHYRIPIRAEKAKVSGRVVMGFMVDSDGNITDFKVLEDIGYGTGDAGIRAIKKIKQKWTPAKQRGVPVSTRYTIPLNL